MSFLKNRPIVRDERGCIVIECELTVEPATYVAGRKYATPPSAPSTQKRILKTVRLASSDYVNSLVPQVVFDPPPVAGQLPWHNGSDRAVAGVVHTNVPSHGDSTSRSITRARPGACSAAGRGVDIKHASYDRYLAKLKGRTVGRSCSSSTPVVPVRGNKTQYFAVANSDRCTGA
jgi:hypothetical protein